ncbi:hypothetical protein GE061_019018 [Apolygus lucorum]|uniref:Uncharacterized protein n=1 Tax=Apolygus lucorum TaxID=248454 RepID=A0A6A4JD63_APOLU|nr:hypothetical protein GE061_019018 [Apolygus lucorum]
MRDLNQQSHVNIYWRLSKWTLPHIRQNYIEDYPNFLRRTILKDPGVCHLYLCLGLKPISSGNSGDSIFSDCVLLDVMRPGVPVESTIQGRGICSLTDY